MRFPSKLKLLIGVFAAIVLFALAPIIQRQSLGLTTSDVSQRSPIGLTVYTRHSWGEKKFAVHGSKPSFCMVGASSVSQDGTYQIEIPQALKWRTVFYRILNWQSVHYFAYVPPDYAADGQPVAFYRASQQRTSGARARELYIHDEPFDTFFRLQTITSIRNNLRPYHTCLTGEHSNADLLTQFYDDVRPEIEALLPLWLNDERRNKDHYDSTTTLIDVLFIGVLGEGVRQELHDGTYMEGRVPVYRSGTEQQHNRVDLGGPILDGTNLLPPENTTGVDDQ